MVRQKEMHLTSLLFVAILIIYLIWQWNELKVRSHNSHRGLLTVEVRGRGLGNIMFNYASLLGIAERNGLRAVLPYDVPVYAVFKANVTPLPGKINNTTFVEYVNNNKKEGTYDNITEDLKWYSGKAIIRLSGYYQSWKYFSNVEDNLRAHFSFHSHIQNAAKKYLRSIIPNALLETLRTKIGVHVRRGDFLTDYYVNKGYTVADSSYLKRAMDFFRNRYGRVLFIVCSNGLNWSKENIKGNDVVFSESEDYKIDLAILASCDHTIMTVGSFGWWAAWLANGTTVYYKDWPLPASWLGSMIKTTDYFMPNWIPM